MQRHTKTHSSKLYGIQGKAIFMTAKERIFIKRTLSCLSLDSSAETLTNQLRMQWLILYTQMKTNEKNASSCNPIILIRREGKKIFRDNLKNFRTQASLAKKKEKRKSWKKMF